MTLEQAIGLLRDEGEHRNRESEMMYAGQDGLLAREKLRNQEWLDAATLVEQLHAAAVQHVGGWETYFDQTEGKPADLWPTFARLKELTKNDG
jgi:hypothetical protein